ncbi:hypothetical protein K7395_15950 [Streptomyces filamentosus]|uniref:Uncharacterized protein n=1 Tax=Streptomyces filamentosus TaxID=67294 RepID=A0ABY4UUY0_STRFL|nr:MULTISPECIES: hypothetical protein [Streptomyces]MYR80342.1 hypothetical protein [Streptomyces sp. SID5466]USC48133.1 hypothetical protein K7395_15950 [Streptomyces filamentosus]
MAHILWQKKRRVDRLGYIEKWPRTLGIEALGPQRGSPEVFMHRLAAKLSMHIALAPDIMMHGQFDPEIRLVQRHHELHQTVFPVPFPVRVEPST